jgi:hypothetical protein
MMPVLPSEDRGPEGGSSAVPDDGTTGKHALSFAGHSAVLTIAAAFVPPILYLTYIDHYAINVMQFDDWSIAILVNSALHGHLSLSQLWSQHVDARVFLPDIIFVLLGRVNHLDVRLIILFSAATFIAAYLVVLTLFRHYIGRLTPIRVLVVGLVWFSLADVQNSLWAYQLSWFMVVLLFVVMMFFLLLPTSWRILCLVLAVVVALGASLCFIEGFILWPMGAICILWARPWVRRVYLEIAAWISAALGTAALYSIGFNFNSAACPVRGASCSPSAALHHPVQTLRYFIVLIGNVIPGGSFGSSPVLNFDRFEIVGVLLLVAAVFIVVQSWRQRTSQESLPLPLMLIGFSLLFDAAIALGRGGTLLDAINNNRYVLPDIILLTGIVMYAWARVPSKLLPSAHDSRKAQVTRLALATLTVFVVTQSVVATEFGINDAKATDGFFVAEARLVVNLDRVPARDRACELSDLMNLGLAPWNTNEAFELQTAVADHLSQFERTPYRYYRRLGPPTSIPSCSRAATPQ